jgi:hypothetical protein
MAGRSILGTTIQYLHGRGRWDMIRKIFFAGFLVSVLAAGSAADGDNSAVPSAYFEGVWAGSWGGYMDPSVRMDVTLTIDKGDKEGVFNVDYSWGMVQFRNRTIPSGSMKTKGRQQGDRLFIQWKSKQGEERQITLQKESENKVKARLDRGGVLSPVERPYSETYLNRK